MSIDLIFLSSAVYIGCMYCAWLFTGPQKPTKLLLLRLCFWPIELLIKLPIGIVRWFINLPLK